MLEFYCPRWGFANENWRRFLVRAKEAGYHGVEIGIGHDTPDKEIEQTWNLTQQLGLKIIVQHYDTFEADFQQHYDRYCKWLERVKQYDATRINSQTGRDIFSFDQNKQLIDAASVNKLIVHETHRGKFSYALHITKDYLEKIPELRLTFDVAHWVNVAESYLQDQESAIDLAIERTDHLHARVGYPEGPQVPDPRIPEWKEALNYHLAWWDKLVALKKRQCKTLTVAPEFGPYPYMVHVPATGKPVADQWEVNLWIMELLKKRYS